VAHKPLREQLAEPSLIYVDSKFESPRLVLLCTIAMNAFRDAVRAPVLAVVSLLSPRRAHDLPRFFLSACECASLTGQHGRLPRPWDAADAESFAQLAAQHNDKAASKVEPMPVTFPSVT
jgi:hypothetical protein